MIDYRQYKPEDFAADTSFRNWKLYQLPEDTEFWENWLKENTDKENEMRKATQLLEAVFSIFNHVTDQELKSEMSILAERAGVRANDTISEPSTFRLSGASWYRIAAALVLAMGIGYLVYFKTSENTTVQKMIADQASLKIFGDSVKVQLNDSDQNLTILLDDGSTVSLTPKSTLTYPKTFSGTRRKVHLTGEAYFEVTKDTDHPFYVIAEKLVVKVVGTSFTIRAKQSDSESNVVVRTGIVSVFSGKISSEEEISQLDGGILLNPNEQITITDQMELHKSSIKKTELAQMSHSREIYQFKATPIAEVFATLERSYGVNIQFDATVMKDCFLTASLDDEPYLQKLNLICAAIGAEFIRLETNDIKIVSKGC